MGGCVQSEGTVTEVERQHAWSRPQQKKVSYSEVVVPNVVTDLVGPPTLGK